MQVFPDLARSSIGDYPYLLANLIGLPVLIGTLYLSRFRRSAVAAGLVLVPFAPLAIFHEPEYWTPRRLGGLPIGIEDMLYLFILGSFSYCVAGLLTTMPRFETASAAKVLRRVSGLSVLAAVAWGALFFSGVGSFESNCIIAGVALAVGAAMRPGRVVAAVTAGIAGAIFHLFNLVVVIALVPAFSLEFRVGISGGIHAIVPLEALFHFLFSAAHVLFFAWAIEPRRLSREQR